MDIVCQLKLNGKKLLEEGFQINSILGELINSMTL